MILMWPSINTAPGTAGAFRNTDECSMESQRVCLGCRQTSTCPVPSRSGTLYIVWSLFLLQDSGELVVLPRSTSWGTHGAWAGNLGAAQVQMIKPRVKMTNYFAMGGGCTCEF